MQIIRSKKTIAKLNNHRFFNPVRLKSIAEKSEIAKLIEATKKKENGKQLDLFSN